MPAYGNAIAGEAMASPGNSGSQSPGNGHAHNGVQESKRLARKPWIWQQAVLRSTSLTSGAKVVACALIEFMNRKSGECFPSEKTLAKSCGLSKRATRDNVAKLRVAGFLLVEKPHYHGVNHYRFALPQSVTVVPDQSTSDDGIGHYNDAIWHGGDGSSGTTVTPEPLKEEPSTQLLNLTWPDDGDPSDRVRAVSYDHDAWILISKIIMGHLGYLIGDRPNGEYPDRFVLSHIPPNELAEAIRLCRAGRLSRSAVIYLSERYSIPKAKGTADA